MTSARKLSVCALLLGAHLSLPVSAQIADTAFFNLWMGTGAKGTQGAGSRLMRCGREDTVFCSDKVAVNKRMRARTSQVRQMHVHEMLLDDSGHHNMRLSVDKRGGRKSPLRVNELQSLVAGFKSLHQGKGRGDYLGARGDKSRLGLKQQGRRDKRSRFGGKSGAIKQQGVGGNVPAALALSDTAILRFLADHDGSENGMRHGDLAIRLYRSLLATATAGFGDNAYIHLYRFSDEIDGTPEPGQTPPGIEELPSVTAPPPLTLPAIAAVPEPATALLMLAGLVGMIRGTRTRH